jgi:hypothetical protein
LLALLGWTLTCAHRTLTAGKANKVQDQAPTRSNFDDRTSAFDDDDVPADAARALAGVAAKLSPALSVEQRVTELIRQATAPEHLATIFYGASWLVWSRCTAHALAGWQPYVRPRPALQDPGSDLLSSCDALCIPTPSLYAYSIAPHALCTRMQFWRRDPENGRDDALAAWITVSAARGHDQRTQDATTAAPSAVTAIAQPHRATLPLL